MFYADDELEPVGYQVYFHCVFSTRGQQPLIAFELQRGVWVCLDGVARVHGMKTLAVGGSDNHCHILLFLPEDILVDQAVRSMKSGSAAWMSGSRGKHDFAWQEGYGAFSISRSEIPALTKAILNQGCISQDRGLPDRVSCATERKRHRN